ncbi:MAG: hypothetical protein IIC99_07675 [Chloroflexi bacterium]|nr:hypothetical protein [Chloroflexota bacterium]
MRYLAIIMFLVVLGATMAYAAPISVGVIKSLGGGTAAVPHCQVLNYSIAASDTISSIDAQVQCSVSGNYNVTATVTSGTSGSGQNSATLTADTPQTVTVAISPSVSIASSTYDADIQVIQ